MNNGTPKIWRGDGTERRGAKWAIHRSIRTWVHSDGRGGDSENHYYWSGEECPDFDPWDPDLVMRGGPIAEQLGPWDWSWADDCLRWSEQSCRGDETCVLYARTKPELTDEQCRAMLRDEPKPRDEADDELARLREENETLRKALADMQPDAWVALDEEAKYLGVKHKWWDIAYEKWEAASRPGCWVVGTTIVRPLHGPDTPPRIVRAVGAEEMRRVLAPLETCQIIRTGGITAKGSASCA